MLDGRSEHMPVSELAGGARIRHIFQDIFTAGLEALDPTRCARGVRSVCGWAGQERTGGQAGTRGCLVWEQPLPEEDEFGALRSLPNSSCSATASHCPRQLSAPPSHPSLPCSELSDDDVRTAIKNSGGIRGSLLIPEAPFELLVRRAIERLLPPALQCKDFVHAELLRIAAQCAPPEVRRFQILEVSD